MLPIVRAKVTFLSHDFGGRTRLPDLSSGQYMPHLVIQSPDVRAATVVEGNVIVDDYLGVRFLAGPPEIIRDEAYDCEFELMYHPNVNYDAVQEGATFTVREGGTVIGFGTVTGRCG
ncbi:hypothetical protein [Adhaeretor mobilis]|uniref:Uncharacterized protein n=1 Tax=Adhaeretor mobilis TaxID=1930276 RepID=A0A517N228_9BACT|nr:hypothetical protein [Adhaeretor mobilis]QDT01200.1 hypothetical protein HG15A2_45420 [Adhaeretor mobilis]